MGLLMRYVISVKRILKLRHERITMMEKVNDAELMRNGNIVRRRFHVRNDDRTTNQITKYIDGKTLIFTGVPKGCLHYKLSYSCEEFDVAALVIIVYTDGTTKIIKNRYGDRT